MADNQKLTKAKAAQIRAVHAAGGIGYAALATMFGVSKTHIKRIVKGESWK